MKISCTQENLMRGLSIVVHLAGKNATLPILSNVLLQATTGGIELTTTNLEIGIRVTIRGKVEREGNFTVQARLLTDYISLLPQDKVDIEVSERIMRISSGGNETTLKGLLAEEFPLLPVIEKQNGIRVRVRDIEDAISKTSFTVALDETRPEIGGVLCVVKNKTITFVGTDSYRLAERHIPLEEDFRGEERFILPVKTLQELIKAISGELEEVMNIYWSENQISFVWGDVECVSRLIEGQYPDYQQIIPKDFQTTIVVPREDLIKTVKTASLFAKSGINDVALQVLVGEKTIVVSSANQQIGENVSRLKANVEGVDNTIVFNYRYLLDGLASFHTPDVRLQIIDSDNPGLLRPEGEEGHIYLVMPIKK